MTTLLGAALLLALLAMDRTILARLRRLDALLSGLQRQVDSAQSAHDHQVASLDRRMRDVEVGTARAEREARIVSLQLTDLGRAIAPAAAGQNGAV